MAASAPAALRRATGVSLGKQRRSFHFSNFLLTTPQSQKTYKIAIRGEALGDNYCSCPDFSINNPGTCKHIAFTLSQLMKIKGAIEKHLHSMIGKDETTGKTYLKIPMPEPEVVQGVFSARG